MKAQGYYQKALELLPPADKKHRGQYLNSLGNSLRSAGFWSMILNTLGEDVLDDQVTRTGGETTTRFLAEAVTAYREALTVRTKETLPQDWAMTQNNLGTVLRTQGWRTGDEAGKELTRQAITAYELALQIITRDALPVQWEETMRDITTAKKMLEDMK